MANYRNLFDTFDLSFSTYDHTCPRRRPSRLLDRYAYDRRIIILLPNNNTSIIGEALVKRVVLYFGQSIQINCLTPFYWKILAAMFTLNIFENIFKMIFLKIPLSAPLPWPRAAECPWRRLPPSHERPERDYGKLIDIWLW